MGDVYEHFQSEWKVHFLFWCAIEIKRQLDTSKKNIFRPAIGCAINNQTTISLGYAVVTNWRELFYVSPVDADKIVRVGVYAPDSST